MGLQVARGTVCVHLVLRYGMVNGTTKVSLSPELFLLHASLLQPCTQPVAFQKNRIYEGPIAGGLWRRLLNGGWAVILECGWNNDVFFVPKIMAAGIRMQHRLVAIPDVRTPMVGPPGMGRVPMVRVWVHLATSLP